MMDSMSAFEIAVLAAQTRSSLARLREFTSFGPADEAALDTVDTILSQQVSEMFAEARNHAA